MTPQQLFSNCSAAWQVACSGLALQLVQLKPPSPVCVLSSVLPACCSRVPLLRMLQRFCERPDPIPVAGGGGIMAGFCLGSGVGCAVREAPAASVLLCGLQAACLAAWLGLGCLSLLQKCRMGRPPPTASPMASTCTATASACPRAGPMPGEHSLAPPASAWVWSPSCPRC